MRQSVTPPSLAELAEARVFAELWQTRAGLPDRERLRRLRALTELEAARCFILLQGDIPGPSRPASGLVEQQRLFSRLRRASA